MRSKYVIGRIGRFYHAIVFSGLMEHRFVGMQVFGSVNNIVSAGFFGIFEGDAGEPKVKTFGGSDSLGIPSTPVDDEFIEVALGLSETPKISAIVDLERIINKKTA